MSAPDDMQQWTDALAAKRAVEGELAKARAELGRSDELAVDRVANAECEAQSIIADAQARAAKLVADARDAAREGKREAAERVRELEGELRSKVAWARKCQTKVEDRVMAARRELDVRGEEASA